MISKPIHFPVPIFVESVTRLMIWLHGLSFAGIELSKEVSVDCGPTLKDFKAKLEEDEKVKAKIAALRSEVETFALKFPMPGHEEM